MSLNTLPIDVLCDGLAHRLKSASIVAAPGSALDAHITEAAARVASAKNNNERGDIIQQQLDNIPNLKHLSSWTCGLAPS
jgi:hypothetical protein